MSITDKKEEDLDQDIEPISQLDDLCESFKNCTLTVHFPAEPEYDYLETGCACITIQNPATEDRLFIDLEGEFTLTCLNAHQHYYSCQSQYEALKCDVIAILENRLCSASVFSYADGKHWLGSIYISADDLESRSIRDIFRFVLKIAEFKKEVLDNGGVAEFRFWNPQYNRDIEILAHDPMFQSK